MAVSTETLRRSFVDTNIWLYAFIQSQSTQKHDTARQILGKQEIIISTQVIGEVCVNLLKKMAFTEDNITGLIRSFYSRYPVAEIEQETFLTASELRGRYSFSYWDSLIAASALQAGSDILYTEDMQHGLVIDSSLTIVNPFLE